VLTEVARRLSRAVVAPNSVYRLGGDEFIVLVPEAAAVAELAGKFCAALTGHYDVSSGAVHLSASVGWTSGPTDDVEDLIRKADTDMYRNKARLRSAVGQ
jgi:diguanylate cyclase (GGDEF)-like protein